jgi:RHS repeat-associated protein
MLSTHPTSQNIFHARLFEHPLVPIGADPTPDEDAALAAALGDYATRSDPGDVTSLTDFLETYPGSPWNVALLINLAHAYYHTGYYSKALDTWTQAWQLAKAATDVKNKPMVDHVVGELAAMHARLGRMTELDALLQSVQDRVFIGPATEKITGAREALWHMKNRPESAFRCGPLALHRIKLHVDPEHPGTDLIHDSTSTQQGFSLSQVEELSQQLGLHFQMAFRQKDAAFIVPSVVHLTLDHYAALVREEGDRYLLQDPTFGKDVWVTRAALEDEASGFFLIPPGELPDGWRTVEAHEGHTVYGKGITSGNDPGPQGPCDPSTPPGGDSCPKETGEEDGCKGLAVSRVHLMLVSLNINDDTVGYAPPVGPAIRFMVRYNQRDAFQPATFAYSNFGPKWTFDWLAYITDFPQSPSNDVLYYMMGGGTRTFTGFDINTQRYALQQYDQTQLTRTSPSTYEMLSRDGSRKVFARSDGSIGFTRKIFLTEVIDSSGNAVSLAYDDNLRLITITDAIGQMTTLSYEHPTDFFKITKVTDPFGRFANFAYDRFDRLMSITDVMNLRSEFAYDDVGDFITTLATPYGVTTFTKFEDGTRRVLETTYADGNRDRVEYVQAAVLSVPFADPWDKVPVGMETRNKYLHYRNTFYWSKKSFKAYPDYDMAKIYHWLHTEDMNLAAGIIESFKEPFENRIWYDYPGQSRSTVVGSSNQPAHIGRVLDDGSTQLYTYEYNGAGNVTKTIDPVGRTLSYLYSEDGIDLLEIRQTREGQDELLSAKTYNTQHLPLTSTDAAGQTTSHTYNTRGQLLTTSNPRDERTTYTYDTNGYLLSIDEPLNASTSFTYDVVGRVRTKRDPSDYHVQFDYDALDRPIRISHPDGTFYQFTYTWLDVTRIRDRAGRETALEYNSVGQMMQRTDPLDRGTLFQWCKCGALRSLTDPMGRTTSWRHDLQGRLTCKQYADGSQVTYLYEQTTSRLRQRIDAKLQVTQYNYNRDNTVSGISYANATVATPPLAFTYDADYLRVSSMKDGIGLTQYAYHPITSPPSLGAGQLASVDGPLLNDTHTFGYDELGRRVSTAINGIASEHTFDAVGRVKSATNALGTFRYTYDGASPRLASLRYPSGQVAQFRYAGTRKDNLLQGIRNTLGGTLLSEFQYEHHVPSGQITSWSQRAGTPEPSIYGLGYDDEDQLLSASVSEGGTEVQVSAFSYDAAGNRLTEQVDATTRRFYYNALNELTTIDTDAGAAARYQWDAEQRLVVATVENKSAFCTYDGHGRLGGIRILENGLEVSNRQFVWCDNEICEERAADGTVSKRFFSQGVKLETGVNAGDYFYTRDHLGSVRELTDTFGTVRARYAYAPFGQRIKRMGDLEADFGFAGMFWLEEAGLNLTRFRAYDPNLGRWLSRDPLKDAEVNEGYNLFSYVRNNPVNLIDPLGLGDCCGEEIIAARGAGRRALATCRFNQYLSAGAFTVAVLALLALAEPTPAAELLILVTYGNAVLGYIERCLSAALSFSEAMEKYEACLRRPCLPPPCPSPPGT